MTSTTVSVPLASCTYALANSELLSELAHWGDALGVHISLGLPARFAPRVESGRPSYRPCDVLDLVEALGKRPDQSWEAWSEATPDDAGPLVQLRRPSSQD